MEEDEQYRALIDKLVRDCRKGQGQIAADRARAGLWNKNANARTMPDQHQINVLLKQLSRQQRAVVAEMLEQAFVGGVHQTLVTLHESGVKPFDEGYEGTPFHDFVGRLDGWKWPKADKRW